MRGSRNLCQGRSSFDIFLVDEGREDQNTSIGGPSSAFRWQADNGPRLNAGLVACDFSGDLDQYCLETLFL